MHSLWGTHSPDLVGSTMSVPFRITLLFPTIIRGLQNPEVARNLLASGFLAVLASRREQAIWPPSLFCQEWASWAGRPVTLPQAPGLSPLQNTFSPPGPATSGARLSTLQDTQAWVPSYLGPELHPIMRPACFSNPGNTKLLFAWFSLIKGLICQWGGIWWSRGAGLRIEKSCLYLRKGRRRQRTRSVWRHCKCNFQIPLL